jgi:hypothetical protein
VVATILIAVGAVLVAVFASVLLVPPGESGR